ncbi:MAG: cytochrome c [Deltaproteobacteria bacterium]|nr:cytochrome c [Deltaproteobacteria bacterium]
MKKILVTIFTLSFMAFAIHAMASKGGGGSARKGAQLFATKGCTACHTIGKGKLVGPDLKGVTKTRTVRWLADWLKNTTKMQATDPTAKKLLQEYNVPMPQQNLTDQEIKDLIDYFKSNDK